MKDAQVEGKSSLLTRCREIFRGLLGGFQAGRAGHGLRLILGATIGLLLLALAFRGVDWRQVGRAVAEADRPLLALALGTVILTTLAKAARWRLLFPQEYGRPCGIPAPIPQGRPRLSKLFPVLLIGQTVNAVLPARLGEITRAYLIGEIEGVDKALALSTVIVEKALDALMLLLLVALLFAFMPLPGWLGRSGLLVSGLLTAILLLVILAAYRSKDMPSRDSSIALYRFLSWIPGIHRFDLERRLGAITAGLSTLYRRDVAGQLVGWSVFVWALAALTNYLTFLALGIEAPFLAAPFLLAALYLGAAAPSSPGRVGVFHYVCVLSLSLFSVDRSLALSYGLVLHLIVFAPMMSLGGWFMWKENYDLSKMKAEEVDP